MRTVELSQATGDLAEYAKEVATEPLVVLQDGRPIAALVAIDNADLETVSLSNNPKFLAIVERSRARHEAEGGISAEEMRRRVDGGEQGPP